jgi:hypothetical protein
MGGEPSIWTETAAWVEAIGAIAAVIGSGWVAARDSRAARLREERAEAGALRREERAALATRTAALNLAILATTQIHDLHVRLKDEAWRGRVTRVSASHVLQGTEHMLTAFPIQSLADAAAMVEFSRFPAALAAAAEIYANLETAVRAASVDERGPIFETYQKHMERVDLAASHQLVALRRALRLDEDATAAVAAAVASSAGPSPSPRGG